MAIRLALGSNLIRIHIYIYTYIYTYTCTHIYTDRHEMFLYIYEERYLRIPIIGHPDP